MSEKEVLILIEQSIKAACDEMVKDCKIIHNSGRSLYLEITNHEGKVKKLKIFVWSTDEQ